MASELGQIDLTDLLGSTLRVEVGADRVLYGVLVALDCHANYLLDRVVERRGGCERELGLVSVPSETVGNVKIHAATLHRLRESKAAFRRAVA
ncbi:AaceriAEL047Cp [[Ashbya] aceris (nom. inval.)]|nr:AaceriAEL047Cp [[Ashbya] aceris (nom. inval.)]